MIHKLLENILSFGYKVPKDPEKLLYDFYFLVGYVYGNEGKILKEVSDEDGEQKAAAFVLQEAVNDCVNNLQGHMLRALKWSLSAEFRHTFDKTSSRYWERELKPEAFKFLKVFREKYNALSDDYYRVFNPGRKQAKLTSDEIASAPDIQNRHSVMSGRNATYMDSYLALQSTQKQLGYTEDQFSDVLISVYDDISWAGSYGGKNWAKIAKAYKKLLAANTLPMKIVYIDHAYDLQHNTGSVFTKVKAYYKEDSGNLNWLAKALDWKRDAQDIRDYYDKVSLSLRSLVGWVAKKFGLTVEERFPFGKEDTSVAKKSSTEPSPFETTSILGSKVIYIGVSLSAKEVELMSWLNEQGYINDTLKKAAPSMGYYEVKGPYLLKLLTTSKEFKVLKNSYQMKSNIKASGYPYFNSAKEFLSQVVALDTSSSASSELKVGDVVKLIVPEESAPKYGWGSTSSGDIGKIIYIKKEGIVVVKFPTHLSWNGIPSELVKVGEDEAPKEFKVGDTIKIKKKNKGTKDLAYISGMKPYEGKYATITKKSKSGYLELDIDEGDNWWDPSWVESPEESPVPVFEVGDKITIKKGNKKISGVLAYMDSMKTFEGGSGTITKVIEGGLSGDPGTYAYKITTDDGDFFWAGEWLEKVEGNPTSKSSKPNFTESWTVKCGAKGSVKMVLLALEHQNSKFPGIKWSAGQSPTEYTPPEPCFIYIRPAREKPSGYEITTGSIYSKSTATHVVDADDFVKFIK
jgi:hypothetical protein